MINFHELKEHVLNECKETKKLEKRFEKMIKRMDNLERNMNELKELKNTIRELHEAGTIPSKTIPNNPKRGNPSQIILRNQHHPDTKTRQRPYKKRKLQANIHDEHRCKNLQYNIGKPIATANQKTYSL